MTTETETVVDPEADMAPEEFIHIVWGLSKLTSLATRRSPLTLCRIPMLPEYWKQGPEDRRLICKVCFGRYKSLGGLVQLRHR